MNSLSDFKKQFHYLFIALLLAWFGFAPVLWAVVPQPDGGYPGGNTAEGQSALLSLTTGGFNTAAGFLSLRSNTTGSFNTAIGAGTLFANTADQNTAVGAGSLLSNTIGGSNTANGAFALFNNTTSSLNTATGARALFSNVTGEGNTANGFNALSGNTAGEGNTAIGDAALAGSITGNFNIAVGTIAGSNVTTASSVICIGSPGANVDDSCFIGSIRGAVVSPDAMPVLIDSSSKLGTTIGSSRRFKTKIKPMGKASEALFALAPVSFRYKTEIDPAGTSQFGLVAEDVEKVNPDLIVRDKEGRPYSVRYDQVNAMLLNEFLKEHRKNEEQGRDIQEQKATIARQQKQIDALTAGLEKVSAQLEASGPAPQVVLNNQ